MKYAIAMMLSWFICFIICFWLPTERRKWAQMQITLILGIGLVALGIELLLGY